MIQVVEKMQVFLYLRLHSLPETFRGLLIGVAHPTYLPKGLEKGLFHVLIRNLAQLISISFSEFALFWRLFQGKVCISLSELFV